ELHERDQRVPAGEQLGVLAALGQQPDGLLEALGRHVVELRRDHSCPPSGVVGPKPGPRPCSPSSRPCSVSRGPSPAPFASWIACHTRIGVYGRLMKSTPSGRRASITALPIAGVAPIVPASPTPLTPSVLTGDGVSVRSVSNVGISA